MSEAEQPKILDETPDVAPQPAVTVAAEPARGSNAPAWLALLLALLACLTAGWSVWQLRQADGVQGEAETGRAAALNRLASQNERLQQRLDALDSDIPRQQELVATLADLQAEQQRHGQRLESLQGDGRSELRLAEAEHLLRLAGLRLSALQDVDSAVALLEGADGVLRDQNDPAAFAARRELARALEALRSRPQLDRTGLYLRLGALRAETLALVDSAPEFERRQASAPDGAEEDHWARWWQQLSSYVRIEFDADQDIRPLLAGQSLAQVRLAFGLALEQAQWAVLNGEEKVYREALEQARDLLQSHFSGNRSQVQALSRRLQTLADEPVGFSAPDVTPALEAFQAYLLRRQSPAPVEPAAPVESGQ